MREGSLSHFPEIKDDGSFKVRYAPYSAARKLEELKAHEKAPVEGDYLC
jgi:hypothetical protein